MKKNSPLLRVGRMPVGLRMRLARFALWRLKHGRAATQTLLLVCLVGGSAGAGYMSATQASWKKSLTQAAATVMTESQAETATEMLSEMAIEAESATISTFDSTLHLNSRSNSASGSAPASASETATATATATTSTSTSTSNDSSFRSPVLASAIDSDDAAGAMRDRVISQELGKLQAEVVRLRVLFLRLANLAELNDGEFDLDMPLDSSFETMQEQESSNEIRDRLFPGQATLTANLGRTEAREALPLVKQALVHISEQSERMLSVFRARRESFDSRVSGMPVVSGRISSRYGYRVDPISGRRQLHAGLDLVSSPGSRIMALADGVVTYSGKNGGYGNLVELEHAGGFRTRYAHNSLLLVPLGGLVKKGQSIATMGSTGRSTGTHVHVEVRHNGLTVDPQLYIR